MKIKTSKVQAIELGVSNSDNNDIELLGTEALKSVASLKHQIEIGFFNSSQNSFLSVYGTDCKFFYSIEVDSEIDHFIERGIGHVEKHNNKFFLRRARPLYYIEGGRMNPAIRPRPITKDNNINIIVSSYIPQSVNEILGDEHSVIIADTPHLPTYVALDENSVLGRLGADIESVSFSDLVDEALKKHTKNLILKSPKVSVKQLVANSIQLNASKNGPEKRGTLYFNDMTGKLMYFDGQKWHSLLTEVN